MEKPPQFIKDFSKEESPEERNQTAQEIKDIRNQDRQQVLEEGRLKNERELQYAEEIKKVEDLSREIEEISSTLPNKLLNFFKYKKTLAKLNGQKQVVLDFDNETENTSSGSASKTSERKTMDLDPQSILKKFYKSQEQKWSNSPYSKEDIEKNFTAEHLASLSLEGYVLLMKRFSAQMVTHVTRQGIRDHLGAVNHYSGSGAYHDGFKEIVNSGVQKSHLEISIAEEEKRESMKKYLNLDKGHSREDIQKMLLGFTSDNDQNSHGSFSDMSAIHFATEEVADAHYGAEKGNEIFFAYPSAFIASQYYFSGQLAKPDGGSHNNQWVWTENKTKNDNGEEDGLDINTGLVFIPANARVDAKNGSRYELDKEMNPSSNIELENKLMDLIKMPGFKDFSSVIERELGQTNIDLDKLWENDSPYLNGERELKGRLNEWAGELKNRFNIDDEKLQKLILTYRFAGFANHVDVYSDNDNNRFSEDALKGILSGEGLGFVNAKETISSKEYWEKYFQENPSKRPSKIVYYEGSDPTTALHEWKYKNGLDIKDTRGNLGFDEHDLDLTKQNDVITEKASRFYNLAMDVADEYYAEHPHV